MNEQAPAPKKNVFLVDDHPFIQEVCTYLIGASGDLAVCGEATNCAETLKKIKTAIPDAMVVDIGLKDVSGIELIRELKQRFPRIRILVLSTNDETVYAPKCLQAGAHGYLMKTEAPAKLLDGLRCILKGQRYLSAAAKSAVARDWAARKKLPSDPVPAQLGPRELEVFQLMGQGLMTEQIAQQLSISAKTVQTYRERIKRKLNIASVSELIHRATQWRQMTSL
ncbi:MAG TPA: DNA-binding response regulator [Verrucomicrobia bacterium]|nr:MAG: hypothetical protein A2X46_04180 [Lentisphaerae bacterium GWF2_57_35]HBA84693.1 DNA-binding response regulator [Verrucomicrobiota bacterium]